MAGLFGEHPQVIPHRARSAAERMRSFRAKNSDITYRFAAALDAVDWERRRKSLADPREFIRNYCMGEGGFFAYEPWEEMDAVIDTMLAAVSASVPYHIRVTRGTGKTVLMLWLIVFLIVRHVVRFVGVVSAKLDGAKSMIDDIWTLVSTNDAFVQDFPEFSLPIVELGGSRQRAPSQMFMGKPTMIRKSETIIRFPSFGAGCPLVPWTRGGAIVAATGFEGKVRGLRVGKLRPEVILFDDLQDDEIAESPERVAKARRLIYKTYMKLGRADERAKFLMTSTPSRPDDLSESFANDPNWHTETFPMMLQMPNADAIRLWREYKRIRDRDIEERKFSEHNETKFYLANREKMDADAKPMFNRLFEPGNGEVSAIQHAMNLFLEDEESFMCECQMTPVRDSAALIVPRSVAEKKILPDTSRRVVPSGYVLTVAATDINPSYALTTAVTSFKPDRTAHVIDHVITPINIPLSLNSTEFDARLMAALEAHGAALRDTAMPIRAWAIDGSGDQMDAVCAFARIAQRLPKIGFPTAALLGRSNVKFNPAVKSRIRDAINETVECGDAVARAALALGRNDVGKLWMYWNADKIKESVLRALLSPVGAPGGLTMYAGGDHSEFIIQLLKERLEAKVAYGDGRDEFRWKSADPHDYLDAVGMCYALAAHFGIGGGVNSRAVTPRRVHRPKVIVQ